MRGVISVGRHFSQNKADKGTKLISGSQIRRPDRLLRIPFGGLFRQIAPLPVHDFNLIT